MRRFGAIAAIAALTGCAVARPLIDRDMSDAPYRACTTIGQLLIEGRPQPGAPPQCFVLAEERSDGTRGAWNGNALQPGTTLVAVLAARPECQGTFTHLTVTGSVAGSGAMTLSAWDMHARPGQSRDVRWRLDGAEVRTFALADIGSTLMNPAGARITVLEGQFDPGQICFRSY